MKGFVIAITLGLLATSLWSLPVSLGTVEIGLESFDGYQEGLAYISTDESGERLEILLAYRGFGLDTVSWDIESADTETLAQALLSAAFWRSRLLEHSIGQTVLQETGTVSPQLTYVHQDQDYVFGGAPHILQFERQGREYAMTIREEAPGAETRRSGRKTLPVFTLHVSGDALPILRDLVSGENRAEAVRLYTEEQNLIEGILGSSPETP